MMKILLVTLLLLLPGCLKLHKAKSSDRSNIYVELQNKADTYKDLIETDANGFIMTDKCDSLLFTGLLSAAGKKADIHAAQAADGSWHRRPGQDCGEAFGNSRSTISRDMIVGLMWHVWKHRDLDTANELMLQVKERAYRLKGQGTIGELLLTPAMITTLAHIIKKLGGPRYELELALPAAFSTAPRGFVRHLSTWLLVLHAEVAGGMSSRELGILETYKKEEPKNPLFLAAYHRYKDGNQVYAVVRLLDTKQWPANSLPTTDNHCSSWPIERDTASDNWKPCSPLREHTGAELPIIFNLLLRN